MEKKRMFFSQETVESKNDERLKKNDLFKFSFVYEFECFPVILPNGTSNRKCSQFFNNVRTFKIFIMKHFRHEKVMTIRTLTIDQQYVTVLDT